MIPAVVRAWPLARGAWRSVVLIAIVLVLTFVALPAVFAAAASR